jgi:predicted RNA-binding Zn ribbon-like protein
MASMIEPGGRAPAPGVLGLVQRFANTLDPEHRLEQLATPAGLAVWLGDEGLLERGRRVSAPELARAIELRDAIRHLAAANNALAHDPAAADRVNAAARRAELAPVLADGMSRLEPQAGGIDGALGRIVAAVHAAVAEGTWERLKACERPSCRWTFYDGSRNRSGRWCSMAICGSREKSRRAYRRRRSQASEH